MEVKWIADQHLQLYAEGRICLRTACEGILNAIAMSEQQVVDEYTYARNAILQICKGKDDKLGEVLCKMTNNIISDEGNHRDSAAKAAALCGGYKTSKPEELEEAGKINDAT